MGVSWKIQLGLFLVPTVLYGVAFFGQPFPKSEASAKGLSVGQMFQEVGILGAGVACVLVGLFFKDQLGGILAFFTSNAFFTSATWSLLSWAVALGLLFIVALKTNFSLGSLLLFVLFLTHALVGAVELGTDGWIQNITGNILTPAQGKILFVFTSLLMFSLRFCADFIERSLKISPIGLLLICSLLGMVGLRLVSGIDTFAGAMMALAVYAVGKTFFWPTMLAVVGDRFPRTGAVAMSIMGGIGMMSAGLLGGPGLGYAKDRFTAEHLNATSPAIYEQYKAPTPSKFLFLDEVHGLDGTKLSQAQTAAAPSEDAGAADRGPGEHHRRSRDAEGGLVHPADDGDHLHPAVLLLQEHRRIQSRAYRRGRQAGDIDELRQFPSKPTSKFQRTGWELSSGIGSWEALAIGSWSLGTRLQETRLYMQFGVNGWVWTSPVNTQAFEELAPKVKKMGFDLFEFGIESTSDLDYARAAKVAGDNGLAVSVCAAMGPDRDLIHEDAGIRRNGMEYVAHCIDAAKTLGAKNVVGPLYSAVGRTWQQTADERQRDTDLLVDQLKKLSAQASDKGVTLCVEPLNRFETSFMNLSSQAIEVVDRVDSAACGILLDTFHMNVEEKSIGDAIRAAGSRLKHLHGCENDRGAPGSGHVPWKEVAAAVKDAGYDGPVVIESFTEQGEDDCPRRGHLEIVRTFAGCARGERAEVPARAVGLAQRRQPPTSKHRRRSRAKEIRSFRLLKRTNS